VQDDYLDAFGDPQNSAKQVGGDILVTRKLLMIHAHLMPANGKQKKTN